MQNIHLKKYSRFSIYAIFAFILALQCSFSALAATPETGSKSQYVHILKLYDENNVQIDPKAEFPKAWSPIKTCGQCHDYEKIGHGWHFNAPNKDINHGRPGEPWILTDDNVGVQLPLSYRNWKGTFNPDKLGISTWQFTQEFGRQFPGGGPAEQFAAPSDDSKWKSAGNLRIDCLSCHTADRSFDHELWGKMIKLSNFRWASTAAMGIGNITGSANSLPSDKDIKPDEELKIDPAKLPKIEYDLKKFDSQNRVFFDVQRKTPNNRCYTCHTTNSLGSQKMPKWQHEQDVHIQAGLSCVDCHRNGLSHHTVRGYEGELHLGDKAFAASYSCKGCHMDNNAPKAGTYGAPRPAHAGLPHFHIERISCTTCHSGPMPKSTAGHIQTSMAHGLGQVSKTRTDDDLPLIASPVYMKAESGKIEPRNLLWPAYWAYEKDGEITPIHPKVAYRALRRVFRAKRSSSEEPPKFTGFTPEQITSALETLQKDAEENAIPIYIAGGKHYQLAKSTDKKEEPKLIVNEKHAAAAPYSWPFAHNVRPARQAIGVNGCTDCHEKDSTFFYATTASLGPALNDPESITRPITLTNYQLMGWDATRLSSWEQSFAGHKVFKIFAWTMYSILLLIFLRYALRAINFILTCRCCKPKA